jgi:hypothetical protein
MEAPLLALLQAQMNSDWSSDAMSASLQQSIEKRDTRDADRGLPSLLDAWLQLGLAGHPYAHPLAGTRRSRSHIGPLDLAKASKRLLCTGNIHVALSKAEKPTLSKEVETLLNAFGTCSGEPPTPKPLPLAQGPRLLVLQSRGAGSHAFIGLPHRSTSHRTTEEDLAWGAALLDNGREQGPLHRAIAQSELEAMVKVSLSPSGERWEQPFLLVSIRSQDADPVALFETLSQAIQDLHTDGWSPRDHARHNQHLSAVEEVPQTSLRLESQLLAAVFGSTPKAGFQENPERTLRALREGILLDQLMMVMEVGESDALVAYAKDAGFEVQVLSAEDFIQVPAAP